MDTQVWLTILSASFGLWAFVVGWAANQVIKRIDIASRDLREMDRHLQQFITATESRLTALETAQIILNRKVNDSK